MFWVLLVPSLFLLVHFFLSVLGLGFRGGSYFGDLGGVPGVWGSSGFFLFLSCFFCCFLLIGGLGDFLWVWGLFLSLVVFLCLCLLVPFLLLGSSCSFLVPFLFLPCFFLVLFFLFWGIWVVFLWFWVLLVPFLFVLLVPFILA